MKKKFTEAQIVFALRPASCRGAGEASFPVGLPALAVLNVCSTDA